MNRRELFLGAGALAVCAALPAVAAAPPIPFHVLTSRGLFVGTYPSRFPLDAEVQRAIDDGSVTWGACNVPTDYSGIFTGPVSERRRDMGGGWVHITRTNGSVMSSVFSKGDEQYAAQLERVVSDSPYIQTARTNYALHSGVYPITFTATI